MVQTAAQLFNNELFSVLAGHGVAKWQVSYLCDFKDYQLSRLLRWRVTDWELADKVKLYAAFEMLRKVNYEVDKLLLPEIRCELDKEKKQVRAEVKQKLLSGVADSEFLPI